MGKFLIFFLFLSFTMPVYAASDLIGNWASINKKLRYDFLEGFAPKRGVVIQYENGTPKSVDEWEIQPDGIKIGYSTKEYKITGNTMIFDGAKFQKIAIKKSVKIIELKKEPQAFIDTLVTSFWLNPIEEESYQYKKGFSSTSGIYSIQEKKKQGALGTWSFANGVIKIDSNVYPNGRISEDYLILLDSRDSIKFLKRGENAPILEKVELKEKKDRVEDAIYATKAALKEGIVAGGGVALLNASQEITPNDQAESILLRAIKYPYHVILDNAGIKNNDEPMLGQGINVVTGELCEMVQAGIIDPVLVTKSALKNAVSVVTTIISADCVISNMRGDESSK